MTSEEMFASIGELTDREESEAAYLVARMIELRRETIEADTTSQLKPCQFIEVYERVRDSTLMSATRRASSSTGTFRAAPQAPL